MEQLPELIITQQPETCTRLKNLYEAIQQRCAQLAEGRSQGMNCSSNVAIEEAFPSII